MFKIREFHDYLKDMKDIIHMNDTFIGSRFDMTSYDGFEYFVKKHYSIEHMKEYNYIKYVKVQREILCTLNVDNYVKKIEEINKIFIELNKQNILPYIDFKKYLFKIYSIFDLFKNRVNIYSGSIKKINNFRKTINKDVDDTNNIDQPYWYVQGKRFIDKEKLILRLEHGQKKLTERIKILEEKYKVVKSMILDFIEIETKNGIDHSEIAKSCAFRTHLGIRSEDRINNIIYKFIKDNKLNVDYLINTNILKLLNVNMEKRSTIFGEIKGEADGLILSKKNDSYIIDCIIEVKSTIRATFEDTNKFVNLKKYITELFANNPDISYDYRGYKFTKESFINIIEKPMQYWTIYMCVGDNDIIIEKSQLFFVNCLKIIDSEFIKRYYLNNDNTAIEDKFQIIVNNIDNVNYQFDEWSTNINLHNNSNLYLLKI